MHSRSETLFPRILDSITEGVFTVDTSFHIIYLNAAARRITGQRGDAAIGRRCYEVLRASACQDSCPLRHTMATGEPLHDVQVTMLNADMESIPICVSTAIMHDEDGVLVGGVEVFRDVSELEALRKELSGRRSFGDIVGSSPAMQDVFRLIPDVAASDAPALILGDSGTGKELVARAIHEHSPRRDGPFVQVNCGALPDTLLESELFGYVRGAFTDAKRDKPGRFQQADGGTLFLDEVGDLSPAFQVKLLRALQEGEVQPLGSTRMQTVDVRLLSATNRDLHELMQEGSFREDLYYRLCVVPIRVPPLSERRDDVVPLVEHFVGRLAARTGKPVRGIAPAALHALVDYDFPGNVRELINILERAFVLCHGEMIELSHLPPLVTAPPAEAWVELEELNEAGVAMSDRPAGQLKPSEQRALAAARAGGAPEPLVSSTRPEVQALIDVLDEQHWNRNATAGVLGISRGTLWRRMKEYGLI